jgi:hypothetical protein
MIEDPPFFEEISRPKGKANGYAGNGHANGHFDDRDNGSPHPWTFDGQPVPNLSYWLDRELPPRDNLLGELVSTTSRIMLVGPTGLGKTNLLIAIAVPLAAGRGFLHWPAHRAARILYIDGEMPSRLIKQRLAAAVRRAGCRSDNLVLLSREDYPDMPPLNTEPGQRFIDEFMTWAGPADEQGKKGFDLNIFDNLQSLLTGDLREPLAWAAVYPWTLEVTRRHVGQIWAHHANDEGRSYGDKTREWGLDTVLTMQKPVEQSAADIAFTLKCTKARERTPDNRADFEDAVITLENDQWVSDRGGGDRGTDNKRKRGRPAKVEDLALTALDNALAKVGQRVFGYEAILPDTFCVTREIWLAYFEQLYVGEVEPRSVSKRFGEVTRKLQLDHRVGYSKPWVWRVF